MFWSGADFDEPGLVVRAGKFKDAAICYQNSSLTPQLLYSLKSINA